MKTWKHWNELSQEQQDAFNVLVETLCNKPKNFYFLEIKYIQRNSRWRKETFKFSSDESLNRFWTWVLMNMYPLGGIGTQATQRYATLNDL